MVSRLEVNCRLALGFSAALRDFPSRVATLSRGASVTRSTRFLRLAIRLVYGKAVHRYALCPVNAFSVNFSSSRRMREGAEHAPGTSSLPCPSCFYHRPCVAPTPSLSHFLSWHLPAFLHPMRVTESNIRLDKRRRELEVCGALNPSFTALKQIHLDHVKRCLFHQTKSQPPFWLTF